MKQGLMIGWVLILLLFSFVKSYAVGETGAQFLKIGVGPKACAMGEAFVSIADDPSAIYWNPAGLAQMQSFEIMVSQNFWLLDMSYQYVGVVLPLKFGSFCLSSSYSSSGNIVKYEDLLKKGEYTAYDAAGMFAYAGRIDFFHYGCCVKYIQQKIEKENADGLAYDIGLLFKFGMFSAGFTVQNIGPGIKFIEATEPLPFNLKCGIAVQLGSILLSVDTNKPMDSDFHFNAGGQITIKNILDLRAGYNMKNSFSGGAGILVGRISIAYSFIPYRDIDNSHQVSASLKL